MALFAAASVHRLTQGGFHLALSQLETSEEGRCHYPPVDLYLSAPVPDATWGAVAGTHEARAVDAGSHLG